MVSTSDFPQADKLMQVGMVAIAVANGCHEDFEIEKFIGLQSGGRQGRYYRLAASILGLVENVRNHSVLTPLGEEYATLQSDDARLDFLSICLIETKVFKEALRYIREYRPTDQQLKSWFRTFYPGKQGTADRRFRTFVSYLREADLLNRSDSRSDIKKYIGAVAKQTESVQSLVGKVSTKTLENAPEALSSGTMRVEVDKQKRERANRTHWQLIAAKSNFLDGVGFIPKENDQVDLYAQSQKSIVLYEMKSINRERNNLLAQVRKAVSQLYEYRYIFNRSDARICIVTNAEIPKSDDWLTNYLAKDREIAYEWTEDFTSFNCSKASVDLLGEFSPV